MNNRVKDVDGEEAINKLVLCIRDVPEKSRGFVESAFNQNKKFGGLTPRQWTYVKSLSRKFDVSDLVNDEDCHYVYAITDGISVKIGISGNVEHRLSTLQSSNSNTLDIHKKVRTTNKVEALAVESFLHEKCKEHHVTGEWFSLEAIAVFDDAVNSMKVYTFKHEVRMNALSSKKSFGTSMRL